MIIGFIIFLLSVVSDRQRATPTGIPSRIGVKNEIPQIPHFLLNLTNILFFQVNFFDNLGNDLTIHFSISYPICVKMIIPIKPPISVKSNNAQD
jgi:hypothetical protein